MGYLYVPGTSVSSTNCKETGGICGNEASTTGPGAISYRTCRRVMYNTENTSGVVHGIMG